MDLKARARQVWATTRHHIRRWLVVIRNRVPFGVRSILGILLIIGGCLAFLPVLGLWMLPLGVLVVGLDVTEFRQRWAGRPPRPRFRRRRKSPR